MWVECFSSASIQRFEFEPGCGRGKDKLTLNLFRLTDASPDDPDLLPPPDEVAVEIVESRVTAMPATTPAP
ncbi:hypothetical protein RUR49_07850 [Pseudoxanthobacter sp. M-2]|uniref:hypothetical protein n=1 Tax=Pseudoxanthobacter sp. M-2 TaxID=3078754 RepID=UPI0038FC9A43